VTSITYVHLKVGQDPPSLGDKRPFKAVVLIEDALTAEWRDLVSAWLVKAGCLYMMAWGENCCAFDDAVDHAHLDAFNYSDAPDDAFVITTWHENETIAEVFWFSEFCAHHPSVDLAETIILDIFPHEREQSMLDVLKGILKR